MGAVEALATLSRKAKKYQKPCKKNRERESDAFHEGYGGRWEGGAGGQVLHLRGHHHHHHDHIQYHFHPFRPLLSNSIHF